MLVEVGISDLEGVEKQAGAAKIDLVAGDGVHDGAESVLKPGAAAG